MSKKGSGWKEQYGKDADFLKRGNVTPAQMDIIHSLKDIALRPDYMFPKHRPRMSGREKWFLTHLYLWQVGYTTYDKPFPSLTHLAELCDMSLTHAITVCKFLERQGLILVRRFLDRPKTDEIKHPHGGGKPHQFDISPLLNRIRALLGMKVKEQAFTCAQPEAQTEQPKPLPVPIPLPEPEPEPIPEAAIMKAPEWATIKEQALERTPRGAHQWFDGVQGYRDGAIFIVVAPDRVRGRQLSTRFNNLLSRLIEQYCRWCQSVRYDVAEASA